MRTILTFLFICACTASASAAVDRNDTNIKQPGAKDKLEGVAAVPGGFCPDCYVHAMATNVCTDIASSEEGCIRPSGARNDSAPNDVNRPRK